MEVFYLYILLIQPATCTILIKCGQQIDLLFSIEYTITKCKVVPLISTGKFHHCHW